MHPHTSSDIVGDGSGGWGTAVDQLDGDGLDMGGGVQVVLLQDGGVQEAVRRSGVDQGLDGDGRLTWDNQVHDEAKMARGGGGEGGGGEGVCHPGRLLLAGWAISRHHRWREAKQGRRAGAELGVGAREHGPGTGVTPLGGGKLETGWQDVGRLLGWGLGWGLGGGLG